MPCNSDYMAADCYEISISRVACLLDELSGKPIKEEHWHGYHPAVYNRVINGDKLVAELCAKLQSEDVSKLSLEMQMWWRDHKQADETRKAQEREQNRQDALAEQARSRLTTEEFDALKKAI